MGETNDVVRCKSESLLGEEPRGYKVLHSSIAVLDRFLGGFESSKLALLHGSDAFMFDFVYTLCARAVIDLGANVVYVDGGNEMNPYKLSNLCKRYRADKRMVLSKINVARAFTAYQMVTIIDNELEKTVNEVVADVLVVSCLPTLFYDSDLQHSESRSMYRDCTNKLKELTNKYNLITIITNFDRASHKKRKPTFKKLLYLNADKIVRFEKRKTLRVWDETKYSYIDYYPVPCNQTVLDDFLEEFDG